MNIDKQLKKILGAHSKRTTPNNMAGGARRPLFNKSKGLLNLAKGSIFFPFTSPTVKSPTGRLIKGNFPTMNRVMKKFNLKTFGGKNDWDGDGILNKKDCQPFNVMRQDAKLNILMRQRVEKLPIFLQKNVTKGQEGNQPSGAEFIHITQKNLTKPAQEAKQYIYRAIKKQPEVLSEIEEKKANIYITTSPIFKNETMLGFATYDPELKEDEVIISKPRTLQLPQRATRTIFHELKHVEQRQRDPKQHQERIDLDREKNISWEQQKDEQEAVRYAWNKYSNIKTGKTSKKYAEDTAKYLLDEISEDEMIKRQEGVREKIEEEEEAEATQAYRNLMGDKDGDGVNNMMDCDPNDASKQGPYHEYMQTRRPQQLHRRYIDKDILPEHNFQREDGSKIAMIIKAKARLKQAEEEHQDNIIDDLNTQFPVSKCNDLNLRLNKGNEDTDGDGVINVLDCQPRNKKKQDFKMETTVPMVDHPESYGYQKRTKYISPDEYMQEAWASHGYEKSGFTSVQDYEKANIFRPKLQHIKEGIQQKKKVVPAGWLELKEGKLVGQEGRHRAVAARELGVQKIPVHYIETRPTSNLLQDNDGDGVNNMMDCCPEDKEQQGPGDMPPQSLFYAGTQSPSQYLQQHGKVYGFSNLRFAEAWARKFNYPYIYSFTTNQYQMDPKTYGRQTSAGFEISDVEFIAFNVLTEKLLSTTGKVI